MVELTIDITPWLAGAGFALVWAGLIGVTAIERRRAQVLARCKPVVRGHAAQPRTGLSKAALTRVTQMLAQMGERFAAVLGGEAEATAAELASAGYRGRDALLIYAFLKTVLPVAAFVVGAIWVLITTPVGAMMALPLGFVIAGALALSKGVDIVVDQRRRARLAAIRRGFPDMLELLVISSEAGLGPQQALHRIAVELQPMAPELARELTSMIAEISMTNDRRAAYEKFAARVPLTEASVFTQTLEQADSFGTPFARAMRAMVAEQRANRMLAIEEKAARLPVLMTMPLIFCIMPAVFVALVGPAVLSIIDNILAGG